MNEVAVEVLEKRQTIPLVFIGFSSHFNALCLEAGMRPIEIGNRNRDVPHTGSLHIRIGTAALRGNNLDKNPVLRANKVVALILVAQAERQSADVPICERLGVWGGDRKVLDSSEHKPGV